ncbi:MAG: MFS transporter [Actinoallomurus sp.]
MPPTTPDVPPPPRRLIPLLALACGVGVANVYFPQAISPLIAADLHVSPGSGALVVTATQFGYAAGIFLLVPLGDRLPHRRLIVTLLVLTGLGLLAAGVAPGLPVLLAASVALGMTTVVPQVIIPMAVGLVPRGRGGAVTGTMLSGLLGGILLARTFSGTVGGWFGWRAPYLLAAVLVLPLATALAVTIPARTAASRSRQSYPALLAGAVRLMRAEPELRRSCAYQATLLAGFSAAWTSLALIIDGPTYGYGAQVVGLIALAGAASILGTPYAGRVVDRRGPDLVNLISMLIGVASGPVLVLGVLGGPVGLAALVVGLLLLDLAVQCGQVANQARIFALNPEARSRLNTAYMTCAFLGGSAGSWVGVRAYTSLRWPGVCALVALTSGLALARHLTHLVRGRSRRAAETYDRRTCDAKAG